jgi:hypothetical protein
MFKPSFTEQSKRAKPSSQLEAMFKINEGLRLLQAGQQPDQNSSSGTVAEQIQQQGIAALNQPQESPEMLSEGPPEGFQGSSEAIQNTVNTPMGQVAMQANIAEQMKAAQQQQMQQQLMQMASQQPQQMAQGGIAALSANNMNFRHGGVVGFDGSAESFVGTNPELEATNENKSNLDIKKLLTYLGLPIAGAADVVSLPINAIRKLEESFNTPEFQRKGVSFSPASDALRRLGGIAEETKPPQQDAAAAQRNIEAREKIRALERAAIPEEQAAPRQPAPMAIPRPQAMPRQQTMQPPERAGLASLMPALGKVDLSGFEADKQAALAATKQQEQNLPTAYTRQQLKAEREAAAKDFGVDLYGTEAKTRIAALEKEFADQSAARAEANKSRGMDNLITMLTNSGGAPTLFAGLAKGTQAYQAAEKLQKADDAIWSGKKLEFMEKMGTQRDLLNERNKAMMLGDLATVRDRDEKIRTSKNEILSQLSSVYTNSMGPIVQAKIHEATNATNLAISQQRKSDEAANRAAMREGQEFSAIQSRITQNAQTSANIIKAMQSAFDTEHGPQQKIVGMGIKLPGDAQKRLEDAQAAHKAEMAKEIQRAANENYKLEHYQWLRAGKAAGQPEPVKPSMDGSNPADNLIIRQKK